MVFAVCYAGDRRTRASAHWRRSARSASRSPTSSACSPTRPGRRRSIRCSRRAPATTGSRTISSSSATACSTRCWSMRRDAADRGMRDLHRPARRRHQPRRRRRDGLPASRREFRDERPHALARPRPTSSAASPGRASSLTATAPHATGGVYVNFMPEDETDRVQGAYGRELRAAGGAEGQVRSGQSVPDEPERSAVRGTATGSLTRENSSTI